MRRAPSRLDAALAAGFVAAVGGLALARHESRERAKERNVRNLERLRAEVVEYRKRTGEFPRRLEDAGPVPPLEGFAARHPQAPAAGVLGVSESWLSLEVTFAVSDPRSRGARLVGAWKGGGGEIEKTPMDCDRGVCAASKRLSPGTYLYGIVSPDPASPSLPVMERDIRLRAPHGEGILNVDARDTLPDAGEWAYDAQTGHVFIACTCADLGPRRGVPMYKY